MNINEWLSSRRVKASLGPFEIVLETQEDAAEAIDDAIEALETLLVDREVAKAEMLAATTDKAAKFDAYQSAEKALAEYRAQFEKRPGLLNRPYPEIVHALFAGVIPAAEWLATYLAVNGAGEFQPVEAFLLPVGFVMGLVIAAHNLGALLKGLHVAHAVRRLPKEELERTPPAEFFGTSPWWKLMGLLSGLAVLSAAGASLVLRLGVPTGNIPPEAFMMIAFSLGIAAAGENFLWYNPWVETMAMHGRRATAASQDNIDAASAYGASVGEVKVTRFQEETLRPRTENRLARMREAVELDILDVTAEGPDDPMLRLHEARLEVIEREAARIETELVVPDDRDPDSDRPGSSTTGLEPGSGTTPGSASRTS